MKDLPWFLWREFPVHFRWDIFLLSITSTILIYVSTCTLTKFPGCIPRVSQMVGMSKFPWSVISSTNSTQISLPALSLLVSLLLFHLYQPIFSLPLSIFIKCHVGLSVGNKEATQFVLCYLCVNWVTDVQRSITNKLWKKLCDWSLIIMSIFYIVFAAWRACGDLFFMQLLS